MPKKYKQENILLILLKSAGRILAGSLCNRTKQTKLEMLQEKCNHFFAKCTCLQNIVL